MQTCGHSGAFAHCGCGRVLGGVITIGEAQELSSGSRANSRRLSSDIFQGKNRSMSDGTWPPFSAQLSTYWVSQVRILSLAIANVANRKKSIAASRPLHNAPEP